MMPAQPVNGLAAYREVATQHPFTRRSATDPAFAADLLRALSSEESRVLQETFGPLPENTSAATADSSLILGRHVDLRA
jgi:hypothetical protein